MAAASPLNEPLLGRSAKGATKHREILSFLGALRHVIVNFWNTTTDPIYQNSPASRRPFWHLIYFWLAFCQLAELLIDTQGFIPNLNDTSTWVDLFYVSTYFFSAWLPHTWKWSDGFIMLFQALAYFAACSTYDYYIEPCDPRVLSVGIFSGAVSVFAQSVAAGVHVYAGAACVFSMFVPFLFRSDIGHLLFTPFMGCLALVVLNGYVEFSVATLCRDLRDEQMVNEFLLDNTTDGFCSVDCSSGIICSASPHLLNTVGSTQLVGKRFVDLVNAEDHAVINRFLESAASGQHDLVPALVSFSQLSSENVAAFDAKIIPYTLSKSVLRFCIQVQGELRYTEAKLRANTGSAESNETQIRRTTSSVSLANSESLEKPINQIYRTCSDGSLVASAKRLSKENFLENMTMVSLDFSVTDVESVRSPIPASVMHPSQAQGSIMVCDTASQTDYFAVYGSDRRPSPRSTGSMRGRSWERNARRPPCLPRLAVVNDTGPNLVATETSGLDLTATSDTLVVQTRIAPKAKKERRKRLGHVLPDD